MIKKGSFAFILEIMKKNWRFFWYCLVAMTVNVCLSFIMPEIVGVTVDSVLKTEPFDLPPALLEYVTSLGGREFFLTHLYICGIAVLAVSLLSAVSMYARSYSGALLAEHLTYKLRRTLFNHIQSLPFSWHKSIQTGDIMQRCSSDVDTVCRFISTQFIDVIRIVLMLVIAYILMFSINVTLALVCLAFVPLVLVYSSLFYNKIAENFKTADEAEGKMHAIAQENFTGVRVVRAFGTERAELDKFSAANNGYAKLWIKTGKLLALYWSVGDLISALQIALLLIVGTFLTAGGKMSVGELVTFSMYGSMLSWPMRRLGRTLGEMSKAGVSIDRIREIVSVKSEQQSSKGLTPEIKGGIKYDNVSFDYGDGSEILNEVSFEIKPGQTLAILGGTGSGKSTLLHLLNKLYDLPPDHGTITVDGVDIRDIDTKYLRKNIAMVLQEPFLFSDTIKHNLTLATGDIGSDRLERATCDAEIHSSILEFPNGYDTVVGEKGVTLSGGQRQRVAIARALACETPILVFDDSLSAVDVQTDSRIRAALKARSGNITTVLVSHRVATLMDADVIMVLAGGRIAEIGSHEQLLAKGGIYSSVYNIQSLFEEEMESEVNPVGK